MGWLIANGFWPPGCGARAASRETGLTGSLGRAEGLKAGSMRRAGRRLCATALCFLMAALGSAAGAPAQTVAGAPASEPLPERTRAVLEAHCAECRSNGGDVDLDTVADDPALVVPRRPDASRIYQLLLRANPTPSAPTPAEIETVRDWIESLPARDAECRDRGHITPETVEAQIDHWAEMVGPSEAADTRFISLVHLWNACASPASLKEFREAAAVLLTALARRIEPIALQTLGDESAILAFREADLQSPEGEEELLTDAAPAVGGTEAIPADWLAAQFLALSRPKEGSGERAIPVDLDGAEQRVISALARSWTKDVDLVRAAAERGVTARALADRLSEIDGDDIHAVRKLMQGALSRADWDALSRVLDGDTPDTPPAKRTIPDTEIEIILWTDKPRYWPRDLVTINASVSKACHLTLINVDRDGKAVVLFPNDIEQDNLVAPAVTIRVPGTDASYQFRFDRSGEEQIVAICQRTSRHPDGIDYDYEKQRFEILGDWRTYLRTASVREQELRARREAEAARRKRRNGRAPASTEPAAIDPNGPPVEGRAAITVPIDPAGG